MKIFLKVVLTPGTEGGEGLSPSNEAPESVVTKREGGGLTPPKSTPGTLFDHTIGPLLGGGVHYEVGNFFLSLFTALFPLKRGGGHIIWSPQSPHRPRMYFIWEVIPTVVG